MILCDTNILIEFYKNNPQVIAALQKIGVDQIAVSAILTHGVELYTFNQKDFRFIPGLVLYVP